MAEEAPTLAELLYESLAPLNEPDPGEALLKFCEALCAPMQPAYDLVRAREGQAGWAVLFDAQNCPAYALPYLAQYVGVKLTPDMSEAQQRAEIAHPTGWRRGQPESLRIATRRTLEATNPEEETRVIIRPRTPGVGNTQVRTWLSQTPSPSRTEAAVRAALPAWELLEYQAVTGMTYADVKAEEATYTAVKADFATYKALVEALP